MMTPEETVATVAARLRLGGRLGVWVISLVIGEIWIHSLPRAEPRALCGQVINDGQFAPIDAMPLGYWDDLDDWLCLDCCHRVLCEEKRMTAQEIAHAWGSYPETSST